LKDATILSDITSIVYRMATDQSTIVRELTVTMVDEWLRTIPDRWGYIARLLPILLAADHPLHFNYVEDRKRMGLHNDLENGSDDEFLLRDNFHKMVTLMIGNIEHFSAPIKIHAVKALTAAIYVVKARCTGIAIEVLLAVCKLLPTSDAALDESVCHYIPYLNVQIILLKYSTDNTSSTSSWGPCVSRCLLGSAFRGTAASCLLHCISEDEQTV